jgi:hypothetical protein
MQRGLEAHRIALQSKFSSGINSKNVGAAPNIFLRDSPDRTSSIFLGNLLLGNLLLGDPIPDDLILDE